jgi:hypothetical protein
MAKSENVNDEQNNVHSLKEVIYNYICTEDTAGFHPNQISFSNSISPVGGSGCVADMGKGENEQTTRHITP